MSLSKVIVQERGVNDNPEQCIMKHCFSRNGENEARQEKTKQGGCQETYSNIKLQEYLESIGYSLYLTTISKVRARVQQDLTTAIMETSVL